MGGGGAAAARSRVRFDSGGMQIWRMRRMRWDRSKVQGRYQLRWGVEAAFVRAGVHSSALHSSCGNIFGIELARCRWIYLGGTSRARVGSHCWARQWELGQGPVGRDGDVKHASVGSTAPEMTRKAEGLPRTGTCFCFEGYDEAITAPVAGF